MQKKSFLKVSFEMAKLICSMFAISFKLQSKISRNFIYKYLKFKPGL